MAVQFGTSMTGTSVPGSPSPGAASTRTLLTVAADILGANPSASLSAIASTAGIGRTTLHKQYATRQDLLEAVASDVLDRAEEATRVAAEVAANGIAREHAHVRCLYAGSDHLACSGQADPAASIDPEDRSDAVDPADPAIRVECALEVVVREFIPLGSGLALLSRHPMFDDDATVQRRFAGLEPAIVELVRAGQQHGVLRSDLPDWWFVRTLYAQVRVAAEAVAYGRLAPLAAPDLVLNTLVKGLGAR